LRCGQLRWSPWWALIDTTGATLPKATVAVIPHGFGIIAIDETPPPLDLTPVEIEALAETLLQYQAECAPL
jgi:hypothetical protein